jgi:hypothetical protein
VKLSLWITECAGRSGFLGFDSRLGLGIFLFTTPSRTTLGSTQPPIQRVIGALSLAVKRPGREAEHPPLSSAEVKNAWSYTFTPQYVFMARCLVKHRDNFIYLLPRHEGVLGSGGIDQCILNLGSRWR